MPIPHYGLAIEHEQANDEDAAAFLDFMAASIPAFIIGEMMEGRVARITDPVKSSMGNMKGGYIAIISFHTDDGEEAERLLHLLESAIDEGMVAANTSGKVAGHRRVGDEELEFVLETIRLGVASQLA